MCPSASLSTSYIDINADDTEILTHLGNMENGLPSPSNVIKEDVNPCTVYPSNLPEKMFYLIPRKEEKRLKVIEEGYWQDAGRIPIGFGSSSTVGWKTTWEFYTGQRPDGDKTDWVMQEYRMEEKGSYLLYRVFRRDQVARRRDRPDADGEGVDSILMRMLHAEECNPNLPDSMNRSQVIGGHNQHGRSGVSSNSFQNVRLDLYRRGPAHSPEDRRENFHFIPEDDYMELINDLQPSSPSSENSFIMSVNSDGSLDLEAVLHGLQSGERARDVSSTRQQHSNQRFNMSTFTINSDDDGFIPEALLHELEPEEVSRDVLNRRQQHSNDMFGGSSPIDSDDGFNPEDWLLQLQSEDGTRDASNQRQQRSNRRFNHSGSIDSDDGFFPEDLLHGLQPGEMTRGVSSRGQQSSNSRLNGSASISFNPDVLLRELQSGERTRGVSSTGQQNSNSRLNSSASIDSYDGFNPDDLLRVLQSGMTTGALSRGQQNSNSRLDGSASTNSYDGFNTEPLLRELQSGVGTRDYSSGGQQHSNSRMIRDVSSNGQQHFNSGFHASASTDSDDGFDPGAMLRELEPEEMSMNVSNRGQQHSNGRFSAAARINSDVGFVPDAMLCQLQSGETTRGVSSKGQQHFNQRFTIFGCQGSQQMVMKPPLSGSLRSSSNEPAKEIISLSARPTSMMVPGALRISAPFEPPLRVSAPDIGTIESNVQRANQGPSTQQDRGTRAGSKKSPGSMAKLIKLYCCFMPN